jgi:hypothetical protein
LVFICELVLDMHQLGAGFEIDFGAGDAPI